MQKEYSSQSREHWLVMRIEWLAEGPALAKALERILETGGRHRLAKKGATSQEMKKHSSLD
jgi:hypothetical protein